MRDWKVEIIQSDDASHTEGIDIDIINGEPAYLDYEPQTYDQRAALSCYMSKGTLPGQPEMGISWASEFTPDNTIMQVSNECQQAVASAAGSSSDKTKSPASGYNAQVISVKGSMGVIITRG